MSEGGKRAWIESCENYELKQENARLREALEKIEPIIEKGMGWTFGHFHVSRQDCHEITDIIKQALKEAGDEHKSGD